MQKVEHPWRDGGLVAIHDEPHTHARNRVDAVEERAAIALLEPVPVIAAHRQLYLRVFGEACDGPGCARACRGAGYWQACADRRV